MKKIEVIVVLVLIAFLLWPIIQLKRERMNNPKDYYFSIEALNDLLKSETQSTATTLESPDLLEFRGIDFYPSPYPYDSGTAFDALENLLEIPEINYVQLRFFLLQESLKSSQVTNYYGEKQDHILRLFINKIHKKGKKVCLMPTIHITRGGYVADLKPENKYLWFDSYCNTIIHYAKLAEENKVELFSIGNEMTSLYKEKENWVKLIVKVREIYHGKLTVKLNCWYTQELFNETLEMSWLDKVDYIGIAAYFDLTNKFNPTKEELIQAWYQNRHGLNIVNHLETLSKKYNKPIIFLDIGYRNVDGCNIEPWNGVENPPSYMVNIGTGKEDAQEAILCAQALFEVFKNKSWWKGTFWFYWPTQKTDPKDTSFALWGKNEIILTIREKYSNSKGRS